MYFSGGENVESFYFSVVELAELQYSEDNGILVVVLDESLV